MKLYEVLRRQRNHEHVAEVNIKIMPRHHIHSATSGSTRVSSTLRMRLAHKLDGFAGKGPANNAASLRYGDLRAKL